MSGDVTKVSVSSRIMYAAPFALLTGGDKRVIEKNEGIRVRKLTQLEAWRLMGFEDEDFYRAQAAMNKNLYGGNDRSGSQLYKQAGNSIVVDVLCAIMGELYQAMPYLFEDMSEL